MYLFETFSKIKWNTGFGVLGFQYWFGFDIFPYQLIKPRLAKWCFILGLMEAGRVENQKSKDKNNSG